MSPTNRAIPYAIFAFYTLVYLALAIGLREHPRFDTIEHAARAPLGCLAVAALLLAFGLGLKHISSLSTRALWLGFIIFGVLLAATPIMLSADANLYALRGRVFSLYDANPYITPATDFANDPLAAHVSEKWASLPSPYPPLWSIFEATLASIAPASIGLTLFLFQVFGFIGSICALLLLVDILKPDENSVRKAIYLWGWNPFVLVETINSAHNEVWMLVFGLLAYRFLVRRQLKWVIPSLVLATLVKYLYALLLPLVAVEFIRKKENLPSLLFWAIAISAPVLLICLAPFWNGGFPLAGVGALGKLEFITSDLYSPWMLASLAAITAITGTPAGTAPDMAYLETALLVGRGLFVLLYLYILLRERDVLRASTSILIAAAVFLTPVMLPWYVLWFLPLLLLAKQHKHAFAWSAVGLAAYPLLYSTSLSLFAVGAPMALFLLFFKTKRD